MGELTTDLLIELDRPRVAATQKVKRLHLPAREWAAHVTDVLEEHTGELAVGGSVANVSAAFAASERGHNAEFVAVEVPLSARPAPDLRWRGFSSPIADLTARRIRVHSDNVAPTAPDLPGALVYLTPGPNSAATQIVTNAQVPTTVCEAPGDLLVLRTDHISVVNEAYVLGFRSIAFLLADDGAGWDAAQRVLQTVERSWVFGTVAQITAFGGDPRVRGRRGIDLIGTDGPSRCVVLSHGVSLSLPVPRVDRFVSDLGAGDAYMGGYLGAAVAGAETPEAHAAGCAAAAAALMARGARGDVTPDLNSIFPDIGRSSPRRDEGDLYLRIRASPGVVLLTGGQTGVDSLAAAAALGAGLPVHLVLPRGMRQEDGAITAARRRRLEGARFPEFGSESFRYRTWACTYLADAIVLLDRAGGEGSEETRRAAQALNRPLLDLGGTAASAADIAVWLRTSGARVVLIAGSRASLMPEARLRASVRAQLGGLVAGVCRRNAQLVSGSDRGIEWDRVTGRVGIASALVTWLTRSGGMKTDEARTCFPLSARDVATALARQELDWGVTWPSLLPRHVIDACTVLPLGAYPVHYGFLTAADAPAGTRAIGAGHGRSPRLAVQYAEAFAQVDCQMLGIDSTDRFEIEGSAELWITSGMADLAYDSYRSGRTSARYGLTDFFPTHWETAAVIGASGGRGRE
jgi:hypothetical protein